MLRLLREETAGMDEAIAKLIASDDTWRDQTQRLKSVPGVGPATGGMLVAELTRAGSAQSPRDSAVVGIASGHHGTVQRQAAGQEPLAGCSGWPPGWAARPSTWPPPLRPPLQPRDPHFATRLTQAGKPFKVILTACMRKLPHQPDAIANANGLTSTKKVTSTT